MDDLLRLGDDQLASLLTLAGVKHKSIMTFSHYCRGLRSRAAQPGVGGVGGASGAAAPYSGAPASVAPPPPPPPLSAVRFATPASSAGEGLHDLGGATMGASTGEFSGGVGSGGGSPSWKHQRPQQQPGGASHALAKRFGDNANSGGAFGGGTGGTALAGSGELPFDAFADVTRSLNVLMLHAKKSYDEAEDEYR